MFCLPLRHIKQDCATNKACQRTTLGYEIRCKDKRSNAFMPHRHQDVWSGKCLEFIFCGESTQAEVYVARCIAWANPLPGFIPTSWVVPCAGEATGSVSCRCSAPCIGCKHGTLRLWAVVTSKPVPFVGTRIVKALEHLHQTRSVCDIFSLLLKTYDIFLTTWTPKIMRRVPQTKQTQQTPNV